jgi:hypothetical protein
MRQGQHQPNEHTVLVRFSNGHAMELKVLFGHFE